MVPGALDAIETRRGFESFRSNPAMLDAEGTLLIDDEHFSAVLNKDGVIGIGDYLFKLIPVKEQVFVIERSAPSDYITAMLQATRASDLLEGVKVFSFQDDIFGELLTGTEALIYDNTIDLCEERPDVPPMLPKCKASDDEDKDHQRCDTHEGAIQLTSLNLKYKDYGLWRNMHVKLRNKTAAGPGVSRGISFDLEFGGSWNVCNRSKGSIDRKANRPNQSYFKEKIYSGARLRDYSGYARGFYISGRACDSNSQTRRNFRNLNISG